LYLNELDVWSISRSTIRQRDEVIPGRIEHRWCPAAEICKTCAFFPQWRNQTQTSCFLRDVDDWVSCAS
jgi:hypothetical protein